VLFVGLTGAVGSGKSEVVRCLASWRVPVFSTDAATHRLLGSSTVSRRLTRRFGLHLLDERGRVDRSKLGGIVFRKPHERRWLEGYLHPIIRREVLVWKSRLKARRRPPVMAVVETPLLHESGWGSLFDGVLCVTAPDIIRRRRLRTRGWDRKTIALREKAQWDGKRKARRSDWVIPNEGSRARLKARLAVWRRMVTTRRKV
jgi:dephospho-CoA kinase